MKLRITVFVFAVLLYSASVASCRLSVDLLSESLSSEEERLLGTWEHVHGIGNVWTKEFTEDRQLHTWGTNLIFGDSEGFYLWSADGSNLYLYDSDSPFLTEEAVYTYSFVSETVIVIDYSEYDKL